MIVVLYTSGKLYFIPKVKKYLEQEGLAFKILVIIDSAPGHPKSIAEENKNVKVVFLSQSTASLLQSQDQVIILCVRACV